MRNGTVRAAAMVAVILLSPVQAVIAAAIRVTMGRPVLFRSPRGGLGGVPFDLLKFRTMTPPRYPDEPDAERVTAVGRWLRASSLDELPSLWNIVRGEMAFVGPRPFHARYVDRYDALQQRRLEVKPGLTGWAQINGRNSRSWAEKFELDIWYVDHRSWLLDLRILLRTIGTVLRRVGVDHSEDDTMPEFLPKPNRSDD